MRGCELNYGSIFELLVAVILSAQCTDKRVNSVTKELFKKYNKPEDFVNLSTEELEKLIFSCGFYKNKAKNIKKMSKDLIEKYNGEVPSTIEELMALSGVGRKTANVVLSEGFKKMPLQWTLMFFVWVIDFLFQRQKRQIKLNLT